jgi:hypothetical protein
MVPLRIDVEKVARICHVYLKQMPGIVLYNRAGTDITFNLK